jgi:phosphoglycerate dehydrogenase-like enzyme
MWINRPGPYQETLEQAGFDVVYPPNGEDLTQAKTLQALLVGIDAILASTEPLTREVLAGSQLRVVARAGVGYDSVDVGAASDLGIVLTITPGAVEDSVAEQTIGMLLCLTRGLIPREQQVRSGVWVRRSMPRLAGKTMGVLGLGRTGKEIVLRALGLKMRVLGYDPYPDVVFAEQHGVRLCSFEELLREADVVTMHLPSTAETANIINAAALAKMKRGSILVNMSRGATVDEKALHEALRSGHLWGAALDVFKQEPLPLDSPLLELDNVVLSPHVGGLDEVSEVAMTSIAAQCIVDLYRGCWPDKCVVNKQLKGSWSW